MFQVTGLFLTNQSEFYHGSITMLLQTLFITLTPSRQTHVKQTFLPIQWSPETFHGLFNCCITLRPPVKIDRENTFRHNMKVFQPYFFKKCANPGLFFNYFWSFQTNIVTIFTTNQCEKMSCPSIILCQDLNPQPSVHEPPPITTIPGLLPSFLAILSTQIHVILRHKMFNLFVLYLFVGQFWALCQFYHSCHYLSVVYLPVCEFTLLKQPYIQFSASVTIFRNKKQTKLAQKQPNQIVLAQCHFSISLKSHQIFGLLL